MIGKNSSMDGYYQLVTDLGKKIDNLKGYDAGYMLPSSGMLMISFNGINYLLTAEALSKTKDMSLADTMQQNKFRFTSRQEELRKDE